MKFYKNWYELAESRDTDEKRLAFYDAIFRYAFDGIVPEKPERGKSKGPQWAAYDAYLTTQPIIDSDNLATQLSEGGRKGGMARSLRKAEAVRANGAKGGRPRKNPVETEITKAENLSPKKPKKPKPFYKVEVEGKVEVEDESKSASVTRAPAPEGYPTLEEVLLIAGDAVHRAGCETIPEDFAREWYSTMQTSGWRDTQGKRIMANGWRGKFAFAWQDEKRRRDADAKGGRGGYDSRATNIHHRTERNPDDAF